MTLYRQFLRDICGRLALVLLLGCLVLGCLALSVSAATPLEYDRALAQVQADLVSHAQAISAEEVPSGEAPSLLAQRILGPIRSIDPPGGAPVPVDTSRLIGAIQAAEATKKTGAKADALDAVGSQIGTLRTALRTLHSGAAPDFDAAKRTARTVLARPEFGSELPPPPSVAERLAAWLNRVFSWKSPSSNVNLPSINPKVILGILIVIAAGAFAVLVGVIVQAIGRRTTRSKPLALDAEEAVLVEARDNDSLLALAEQQAKVGDYRRAFRLVYLAALVALDTGGVLRFDRSKTNWEYLRALRTAGRGDIYSALTPLTREFDQVWYGFGLADASHYTRALAQYRALLAAPQAAASTPAQGAKG